MLWDSAVTLPATPAIVLLVRILDAVATVISVALKLDVVTQPVAPSEEQFEWDSAVAVPEMPAMVLPVRILGAILVVDAAA